MLSLFIPAERRSRILKLALPVVLTMCAGTAMSVLDVAMIGPLGTPSIAAIGISTFVLFGATGVMWGLLPAVQALVAREFGNNVPQAGMAAACVALLLTGSLSLLIACALYFGIPSLATLLAANDAVASELVRYIQIMAFSVPAQCLAVGVDGYWQGRGETRKIMIVSLLAQLINIPISLVLIYGWLGLPELGIQGAALGTTIACGFAIAMRLVWARLSFKSLNRSNSGPILRQLVRLGITTAGAELIMSWGWASSLAITGMISAPAQAASGVVVQFAVFTIVIGHGYGMAAGSLAGWNMAQNNPNEASRWVWQTALLATLTMLPFSLGYIFAGTHLMGWVVNDPELIRIGTQVMQMVGLSLLVDGVGTVMLRSLQVVGATSISSTTQIASMLTIFLPLSWVFGVYLEGGIVAFWFAFLLSRLALATTLVAFWQSRIWVGMNKKLA